MVKHILMFKFNEKNLENMEHAVSALRGLDGVIEILRFLKVGVYFYKSERSYYIVLTNHVDTQEGLAACTVHPQSLTCYRDDEGVTFKICRGRLHY